MDTKQFDEMRTCFTDDVQGAAAARFVTYLAGVLADLRRVLL